VSSTEPLNFDEHEVFLRANQVEIKQKVETKLYYLYTNVKYLGKKYHGMPLSLRQANVTR